MSVSLLFMRSLDFAEATLEMTLFWRFILLVKEVLLLKLVVSTGGAPLEFVISTGAVLLELVISTGGVLLELVISTGAVLLELVISTGGA